MIPNLLWTILFVTPAVIFCYIAIATKILIFLLILSFIPVFFPNSFFNTIQLSKKAELYKKPGVKFINKFSQNGMILNNYIRKKYPRFKVITTNKSSLRRQYFQTYMFERFHFSAFLFYTIITVYAGIYGNVYWIVILIVSNLFYNIYPNLLQQYIRIKLKSIFK